MNWFNYILPLLISDSLLLCLGWLFPWLQISVWLFVSIQLLTLLILGCFATQFSHQNQFYFGLLILGFILALGMGII